mmetsp:Transcript_115539/g.188278  ORF Transcript_115539/g.188278 Transcript_115539/m.188278 type:complete len:460 (-) Transcript_115539:153-1532(-)
MTMRVGTIVLACLACAGNARRVQSAFNPAAAFKPRVARAPSQFTYMAPRPHGAATGVTVERHSTPSMGLFSGSKITEEEVLECQKNWADAIATISKTHADGGDFVKAAADAAGELYGYGKSNVLFKPTKAAAYPFRPTAGEAMSYFVGAGAVDNGYEEDGGFAINGGKGWSNVKFENHQIELNGETAIAMGTYYFTCATTGSVSKVEYTFGYKKNDDGKARIFLHHSSVPFDAESAAAASPPVTKDEVLAVQQAWSNAIKDISATHKAGGDYIKAAADAAGELYAYGHSNVLFKPTKAAEFQFRPTAGEAMSYFVGGNVVDGGYSEDAGFAINGGKGWADVVYDNHQVELKGGLGIAMGNYDFTCATTGGKTKVEYTFGYKRCDDGKVRIFLHHSSVPYGAGAAAPAPAAAGMGVSEAELKEVEAASMRALKYESTAKQLKAVMSNIASLKSEISGLVK